MAFSAIVFASTLIIAASCIYALPENIEHMTYNLTGTVGSDTNGYGCYCGPGGYGKPLDKRDMCCVVHDRCYYTVKTKWNPLWIGYNYEIDTMNNDSICQDEVGTIQYDTCSCDRMVVHCWRNAPYNDEYFFGSPIFAEDDTISGALKGILKQRQEKCGKQEPSVVPESMEIDENLCVEQTDFRDFLPADYETRSEAVHQADILLIELDRNKQCLSELAFQHGFQPALVVALVSAFVGARTLQSTDMHLGDLRAFASFRHIVISECDDVNTFDCSYDVCLNLTSSVLDPLFRLIIESQIDTSAKEFFAADLNEILSAFLASKEYFNGQVRPIDVENVLAQAARFFEFYYWKCPHRSNMTEVKSSTSATMVSTTEDWGVGDWFRSFFGFGEAESTTVSKSITEHVTTTDTTTTAPATKTTRPTTPGSTPAWVKNWKDGFKVDLKKQIDDSQSEYNDVDPLYDTVKGVDGANGLKEIKLHPDCVLVPDTDENTQRRSLSFLKNDCGKATPAPASVLEGFASDASRCWFATHLLFGSLLACLLNF